jgi:hypothetical protein
MYIRTIENIDHIKQKKNIDHTNGHVAASIVIDLFGLSYKYKSPIYSAH